VERGCLAQCVTCCLGCSRQSDTAVRCRVSVTMTHADVASITMLIRCTVMQHRRAQTAFLQHGTLSPGL
jgi:hypothetical protein